jgi:radical SAM protein with 4Fe4S-binding SPASM domain
MLVSWELTNACNLNCIYCFNNSGVPFADELTKKEIYDGLRNLYNAGVFRIEFSGGEPTIRPDFVDIIKEAHKRDFVLSIASNGTLIDEKIAALLRDVGVSYVQISLDGLEKTNDCQKGSIGAFNRTIKGIEYLKKYDINVHTRMTVTKTNLSEIEDVLKLAISMNVNEFNAMRAWSSGRAMDSHFTLGPDEIIRLDSEMERLHKQYSKYITVKYDHCGHFERKSFQIFKDHGERICQCGRLTCVIKPNGIITPCEILTINAGDLRKEKFIEIWNNSRVFEPFRSFNTENLKGTCAKCSDKNVCGGNCRSLAMIHYGDFYAEDPTCWRVMRAKEAK